MGYILNVVILVVQVALPKQIQADAADQPVMTAEIPAIILISLVAIHHLMKPVAHAERIPVVTGVVVTELVVLLVRIRILFLHLVAHLQTRAILQTQVILRTQVILQTQV